MKKNQALMLAVLALMAISCKPGVRDLQGDSATENKVQTDTSKNTFMKIENSKAVLEVNLNGGSYPDFHLKEIPLNPLDWRIKDTTMPDFMGHFLCFDRWGPPSDAEKANGFKHHGEASTVQWKTVSEPKTVNGITTASVECTLPMGGLRLTRKIEMPSEEPLFFVTEEIKNLNKYGRMYNIVQHVTIAPPFLDKTTIFDNNTEQGYVDKEDGSIDQESPVIKWPSVMHNGEKISLRQFEKEWPRVASFMFSRDDKYGWVTACNPSKGLMLGYIWKTEEYPWINFWRSMENDMPAAFGMEFGTTGLHESFPVLARKAKIFDRNIYDFIDADQVITKSFTAFLARIPDDYKGVGNIEIAGNEMIIKEKSASPREIKYHLK